MGVSIGIEVSKQHLDWASASEAQSARVQNTRAGIRRLVVRLAKIEDLERVVVESTGGYERALTDALAEAGLPVVLVNPWRVRRFGEGLGILAKTDAIDAHLLALFGERAAPPQRPAPSRKAREMADLVRRRRQRTAMIVAGKNRLEHAGSVVRRDIQSLVAVLERRATKLDAAIDKAIAANPNRAEARERLEAVPWIGPGIARALLVDLPELGTMGRRQIAAGKPPEVAFLAIARKLLTILNAMLRDGTSWKHMPN